ncbi:MAG: SMI1/KNR4 family protein [Symploca sp. SIO2C1]|nr:SMI1/KNR4 family protein [Symploca sp. SIO2C1]
MEKPNIETLIESVQSLGVVNLTELSIPLALTCQTFPAQPWRPDIFKESLKITLPEGLKQLWYQVSELRLFEDLTYGQWGLVFWSPNQVIQEQETRMAQRQEDFRSSDLIIGEFLGDSELLLIRCNEQETDFGKVMIALPLEQREEWYVAADSLEEFLSKWITFRGEKFWESSFVTNHPSLAL